MIAVHSFLIPPLDPWWEAGSHLGSRVGGGIPGWTLGGKGGIPRLMTGPHPNPAFLFTWVKLLTGGVYVPGLFA